MFVESKVGFFSPLPKVSPGLEAQVNKLLTLLSSRLRHCLNNWPGLPYMSALAVSKAFNMLLKLASTGYGQESTNRFTQPTSMCCQQSPPCAQWGHEGRFDAGNL